MGAPDPGSRDAGVNVPAGKVRQLHGPVSGRWLHQHIQSKAQSLTLLAGGKTEVSQSCRTKGSRQFEQSAWCRQQAHWLLHITCKGALASRTLISLLTADEPGGTGRPVAAWMLLYLLDLRVQPVCHLMQQSSLECRLCPNAACSRKPRQLQLPGTAQAAADTHMPQPHLCGCNQDLSILGRAQVVDHAHELDGLRSCLLRLGHMQIHLVTVKVSVVGAAHAFIKAQRPAERSHKGVAAQVLPRSPPPPPPL